MSDTNFSATLLSFVERIERTEAEIGEGQADLKEIYKEAKESQIDVKALRKIVAERRMGKDERDALNETLDQYRHALGMLTGTPLAEAAVRKFQDGLAAKGMRARFGRPDERVDVVVEPTADEKPAGGMGEFA